jgi:hypothetical protein
MWNSLILRLLVSHLDCNDFYSPFPFITLKQGDRGQEVTGQTLRDVKAGLEIS